MAEATTLELAVMSGPDDGTVLSLNTPRSGEAYVIGRRDDCDVILPYDSQVSRQHARLYSKDGQWFVQDLGSRNGTYIGKQKIEGVIALQPGDLFRVGRTWLRLIKHED